MFRKSLAAVAAVASLVSTAPGAFAGDDDCTKEVFQAVEKQSKQSAYRMETDVISQEGPLKVKMEYVLPDRMRQVAILAEVHDVSARAFAGGVVAGVSARGGAARGAG